MKKYLTGALLILMCATFASAQGTTGRLTGTVSSPDGVLPGATVTVVDDQTGREQTTTTNGEGIFLFPQLEFGNYTVRISNAGFKTNVATEVKIDVGREYKLDRQLEIGDVQETVVVTAGADVVTSGTGQVSNTVSPEQILSLPLITRNPLSLTTLQAGVASNSAQNTTINGMRTTFTNITRDGINIQDTFIRSNATDFAPGRPSVDDTGEFTITTANQEADQGYGGAQIRLVTPRGTQDFHGALFAYNRNSHFAANTFFDNRSGLDRPFRNRNQYGGKISGPVPVPGLGEGTPTFFNDKGFFFFAYEGIRDPVSSRGTRTILSPSARNGAFTYNRTTAGDPNQFCPSGAAGSTCVIPNILAFANTTFPGGNIPLSTPQIIQDRVISLLPTTSNFTGGDGLNTLGYTLNRAANQTRNQYSTRIDVDINDRNTILGIFNYNKEDNLRPDVDTTGFSTIPGVNQFSDNRQFTMAYRRVFTSNFVGELRGGVFTSVVPFDRTDSLPEFLLTPLPLVSNPVQTFLSQGRNTKAFNYQYNADLILSKHTLKFGGQLQYFKVNAYNDVGTTQTVTVSTGTNTPTFAANNFTSLGGINTTQLGTANGMLALFGGFYTNVVQFFNIADVNRGFERGVTSLQPFRYESHSLYVADRWAVNNQLTISLGVRYELYPALRLLNNLALEPVLDENDVLGSILRRDGTYDLIGGNAGRENAYYKTDKNNFAPNFGIAWSPSFESGPLGFLLGENRTVIRGGYSWIFGNDSIVTSINNAAVGNQGLGRTGLQFANLNGRLGEGNIPVVPEPASPVLPRTYLQNNTAQFGNFGTVFAIDPNIQTPKIEQYSIGIQREFFGNTALEIRYVGTRSDNLARGVDLNQIDIFDNGFLTDFLRAQNNDRLTGNAFCTAAQNPGCQPLSIFLNTNMPGSGRLVIGTGGLSLANFNNNLRNGTPADLALLFLTNNLNNHPTVADPSRNPFVNFVANPAIGVVDLFLNDAYYQYDSLQVELRRRFTNGLYFQGNYTFSKNLTNAIGTSQALFEPYLDNNNRELDKQRADFDQTHVFNFNGIYQLPFGKGRRFLNEGGWSDRVFGGFEVSGLLQWVSGAPITFIDTRGTLNRSARSARQTAFSNLNYDQIQDLIGVYEANGNLYWINPSILNANGQASAGYGSTPFDGQVFFNVEPGQTGNIGRALIDGPGSFNVNMALLKNINITETMRLQLRMEAFNVFNNVNFIQNTQLANINSTTFGQITGASASRQVQFAARFEF